MRVLITGASGFVGRNLLLGAPADWEISATYHRDETFLGFLREHLSGRSIQAIGVDLGDRASVTEAARTMGPRFDLAYHLAGNSDPTESVSDPFGDFRANALAMVNFLEAFRLGRLIFTSSGAVYEGREGRVSPQTPVGPRLPYALSKLTAEGYAAHVGRGQNRIDELLVLRLFGAYGPWESPRKIYTRLVQALGIRRGSEFVVRGDGTNLIDAMYIDDLVKLLLAAPTARLEETIIDVCVGAPLSVNDLVHRAARILGAKKIRLRHEGTTVEPIRFRATPDRAAEILGHRPSIPLEVGLLRLQEHLLHAR